MPDVIVVGAGPAGATAAKRCAEHGLDTLIVEKRSLPRDKVCSGMIMGPTAQALIQEEYGSIPETVLSRPGSLKGYAFHVPGIGSQCLDNFTLLTWRRNLDSWMSQRAESKGAAIWQGARVCHLAPRGDRYLVRVERGGETHDVDARFVVGADGAASTIRRFLSPVFEVSYGQIYQECHRGEVDLHEGYFHWFYPPQFRPAFFTVHRKDGLVVMDFSGPPGSVKSLRTWAERFLAENHNLEVRRPPVWRGGCLEPVLYKALIDRAFLPGQGNVLLVGDAAGFLLPVSGEGIGTAVKSGLLAAESIREAMKTGAHAAQIYLEQIDGLITAFAKLLPWFKRIREESRAGGRNVPQILAEAYADTLRPL